MNYIVEKKISRMKHKKDKKDGLYRKRVRDREYRVRVAGEIGVAGEINKTKARHDT